MGYDYESAEDAYWAATPAELAELDSEWDAYEADRDKDEARLEDQTFAFEAHGVNGYEL